MCFVDAIIERYAKYPPLSEPIQVAILLAENTLKTLSEFLAAHERQSWSAREIPALERIETIMADAANYTEMQWRDENASVASFDYAIDHAILSFSVVVNVWDSPAARPQKLPPRKILSVRQTVQTAGTIVCNIPPCGQGHASAHRRILISELLEQQPESNIDRPLYVVDHIKQVKAAREAEYRASVEKEKIRISEAYGQKFIAIPPKNLESVDEQHGELYLQARENRAMAILSGELEDYVEDEDE
jgi:hypothetical protein